MQPRFRFVGGSGLTDRSELRLGFCRVEGAPTSVPWGIALGPDRNLWFTENNSGRVGKVTTSGGFTVYAVASANADLGGIAEGLDGRLWFTEGGPNKIAAIVPQR